MNTNQLYDLFCKSKGVTTDSRKVSEGQIFFALHGENFDGNLFAVQALKDGAEYAVVDCEAVVKENSEFSERLILVDDTLSALQRLAAYHREQLAIPILGIVGSNGKTTTKELVSRVLAKKYTVYATRGNLNNHIGVPLTLLAMDSSTEFGVVEMGASSQKEIELLCSISKPDYGIITNIGNAHLEGFGGKEGIRKGKGELFDFLAANGGRAIVPTEDRVLVEMAKERTGMAVEYYSRAIAEGYKSQLSGDYNRFNIAAAVAVATLFGISSEQAAEAIEGYTPDNNRSQEVVTPHNNTLIIDCYNANPSSMEVAIENIASRVGQNKLLILGDMLELGQWSESEHRRILELAASIGRVEMILVGENFHRAAHSLALDAVCFKSTAEAAEYLTDSRLSNRTILLKGSRGVALEKLIECL